MSVGLLEEISGRLSLYKRNVTGFALISTSVMAAVIIKNLTNEFFCRFADRIKKSGMMPR